MTITTQIEQLKASIKEDMATVKRYEQLEQTPFNIAMRNWFEGRAIGFRLASEWLERDVLPQYVKD
jgi:hypothetical protein